MQENSKTNKKKIDLAKKLGVQIIFEKDLKMGEQAFLSSKTSNLFIDFLRFLKTSL